MNWRLYCLILFLLPISAYATDEEKIYVAERITERPSIDGDLKDECWSEFSRGEFFYEFQPNNGRRSQFKSKVQIVYSDEAIYIAARLFDPNPSGVRNELSLRDDDSKNTDIFGFSIDTYKNGQNAFNFLVTAAGVQIDYFISNDNNDYNWDAVWKSAVKIDDQGWVVEMEIPFYAIRFPKKNVQEWGVNFYRKVQRNREESFWNYVDNSKRGLVNQYGVLTGIKNVEPPLRLSFLPFLTTVYDHQGGNSDGNFSFVGGMDMKYGINESFTLDLSLIPDFSQVRSDDQILNLSPFEVRFSENRPFFTENTDIFSRNGLFYSRRVGQSRGFSFQTEEDIVVQSTPGNAPLINALKISGRTKKGTGLGIFNGITQRTYAEVLAPDREKGFINPETGEKEYKVFHEEERLYDPLTNYNVLVLDQNLKNNSSAGIINTNVTRTDGAPDANVTGADLTLNDKTNTYRFSGMGVVNIILERDEAGKMHKESGYAYSLNFAKVSGKWQYGISRNVESEDYNINDLGYLQAPNQFDHNGYISYNLFKPFGWFNNMGYSVSVNYNKLYLPRAFTRWNINYGSGMTFKNFWSFNYNYNFIPSGEHDYFEARNGQVFIKPWAHNYNLSMSSDSRKPLYINAWYGQWFRPDWEQRDTWNGIYSRLRINNKLSVNYELNTYFSGKDIGFVGLGAQHRKQEGISNDAIIFGGRDIFNTENFLGLNYTFTNKIGLNMRLRHFWSKVEYLQFHELMEDGSLNELTYNGGMAHDGTTVHDINFNAFNIDLNFSWQIAPGSFFTINWKNASLLQSSETSYNFVQNFSHVVVEPHNNSLSFRISYFIDYLTLKNNI